MPTPASRMEKVCGRCQRNLPVEAFNRNSRAPDGLQRWCHGCQRAYIVARPHYQIAQSARRRARYRNEPTFRARILALAAEDYQRHPERFKDHSRLRRARLRQVHVEPVSLQVVAERARFICGLCGGAVNMTLRRPNMYSPSLDHIVPLASGGAHAYENVQLAHLRCNFRKGVRG